MSYRVSEVRLRKIGNQLSHALFAVTCAGLYFVSMKYALHPLLRGVTSDIWSVPEVVRAGSIGLCFVLPFIVAVILGLIAQVIAQAMLRRYSDFVCNTVKQLTNVEVRLLPRPRDAHDNC